MLKINIFWAVFKKPLRMRHCFLFGPYFMPFFNRQFLKCDILPVSNDPVLHSQIYSSRNIFPTSSRITHRSGPSYAPVCVPVYALGLTDWSQLIRSSTCLADPADVELVSQHVLRGMHYLINLFLPILYFGVKQKKCWGENVLCLG